MAQGDQDFSHLFSSLYSIDVQSSTTVRDPPVPNGPLNALIVPLLIRAWLRDTPSIPDDRQQEMDLGQDLVERPSGPCHVSLSTLPAGLNRPRRHAT
ncbi:hypothetical protein CSOJ01_00870 [Colletotrichum sojae]|uniref:Uncharacterized protein n=1 Tax=Colletotrichum sojae TaxID=2175907 RepID=A0A8H6JVL2_9PEZI|nr:hypothetical protein CSOJ01_00870 [Colletotrichum sojae]